MDLLLAAWSLPGCLAGTDKNLVKNIYGEITMNINELKLVSQYHHMSIRQLMIILYLHQEKKKISFTDIALKLQLPKPSLTRALDSLSICGLVDRQRYEQDARKVLCYLTDEGTKFAKKVA